MKNIIFDLQRFAEEPAEGAEQAPQTADTNESAEESENAPQAGGTILGGGNQPAEQPKDAPKEGAPEAYDFTGIVPEGMEYNEEAAKAFGEIARNIGLSQDQASQIASYGMQYMQQGIQAAEAMRIQEQINWGKEAEKELGGDYAAVVAKSNTALNKLSQTIPGIREAFNMTGAGNRIEMIRMMAAIGEMVGEDAGHDGSAGGQQKTIYGNTNFNLYK